MIVYSLEYFFNSSAEGLTSMCLENNPCQANSVIMVTGSVKSLSAPPNKS